MDRRAKGRSGPAFHPVRQPAGRGGLGTGAHPAAQHGQAAPGCLGAPGKPSSPLQCQGTEAATGRQRPPAATGTERGGHECQTTSCSRRPWCAYRPPGSGFVAAYSDTAGTSGQITGPGGHSGIAAGRARGAATHAGCDPRSPLAQPGGGPQGQCRAGPLARRSLRPARLAGGAARGPAGDPGGGPASLASGQGGGHCAPGYPGVSLLAAGSGCREGRGPAPSQPVAHRPARQRVEAGRRAGTHPGQRPTRAG